MWLCSARYTRRASPAWFLQQRPRCHRNRRSSFFSAPCTFFTQRSQICKVVSVILASADEKYLWKEKGGFFALFFLRFGNFSLLLYFLFILPLEGERTTITLYLSYCVHTKIMLIVMVKMCNFSNMYHPDLFLPPGGKCVNSLWKPWWWIRTMVIMVMIWTWNDDHALVSICQMAEGWSWSLGLLVGIVALRALEARYLPPCALLCHTARQILLLCPFLLIWWR